MLPTQYYLVFTVLHHLVFNCSGNHLNCVHRFLSDQSLSSLSSSSSSSSTKYSSSSSSPASFSVSTSSFTSTSHSPSPSSSSSSSSSSPLSSSSISYNYLIGYTNPNNNSNSLKSKNDKHVNLIHHHHHHSLRNNNNQFNPIISNSKLISSVSNKLPLTSTTKTTITPKDQQQQQHHHLHMDHGYKLSSPVINNNNNNLPFLSTSTSSTLMMSSDESSSAGDQPVNRTRFSHISLSGKVFSWPVKRVAEVNGDIILGGLMMIHQREDRLICGEIMPQGGIQVVECMLYTLDWINNQEDFLPGITLGAYILDDCDKDTYGLEQSVDFIKGSISNIGEGTYFCKDGSTPALEQRVISGVLGAASSVTSIQVANLLRLFRIPQISFFSTSPELSNKERFKYFLRTVPSDQNQAQAMVEIIQRLNWTYVSVLYEESNYGAKAFEVLDDLLTANGICIAVREKLPKDSGVAQEKVYDSILHKLLAKPRARGVVVFGSDQEVKDLMQSVKRNNVTGRFQWIGSDGWSARALVYDGNEHEVEGTLSIQPMANPVYGFDDYFLSLTPKNNKRNPWFIEFWEHYFRCKWNNSQITPFNQEYDSFCTGEERMSYSNGYQSERQLQFVSDAVLVFGYALREMHQERCGGKSGICGEMNINDGDVLLEYLKKVQFTGLSGDQFRFSENQNGPIRYNILHFKRTGKDSWAWVKVGKYQDGILNLNMESVRFTDESPGIPLSVCSPPCEKGQAKKYIDGEKCCWHCSDCGKYQVLLSETECYNCANGFLPDETQSICLPIPEDYVNINSSLVIGAITFSSTGVLTVLWIICIFIKYKDTPIVRASGRELSFVLLAGLLLCYSITYLLMLRPTNFVCGSIQTMIGCSFSMVYSSLLTKTNRIARIFDAGKKSAQRPSFISPQSQLCICVFMIFVQVIITLLWFAFHPPRAVHTYPTREDNLIICSSNESVDFFLAFAYPFILIFVCTVYAVLTRKIPEAFNESKYIGFTMYTTCVIWIAFIPIYFTTRQDITLNITTLSYSINCSATIAVACLFSPKLYIILLHPEKNIRQSMMPYNKYGTTKANPPPTLITCTSSGRMESATQSEETEMLHRHRNNNNHDCQPEKVHSQTQTSPIISYPDNNISSIGHSNNLNTKDGHLNSINTNS
ncbi:metabotropic glutamate receptor 6-like [Panonychus citri]|uniref:metabotropic glutamate receptor 6-like n=1 Tax=Panonychus citri TaxID=50023 RepID=UPI0023082AF2|nr:metabotropic glutamate receptor 6-like [Panonychus citri]